MLCRATQDKQVILESSDKMWSTRGGNRKPLQYSCLKKTMNIIKKQNMTLGDEPSIFEGGRVEKCLERMKRLGQSGNDT